MCLLRWGKKNVLPKKNLSYYYVLYCGRGYADMFTKLGPQCSNIFLLLLQTERKHRRQISRPVGKTEKKCFLKKWSGSVQSGGVKQTVSGGAHGHAGLTGNWSAWSSSEWICILCCCATRWGTSLVIVHRDEFWLVSVTLPTRDKPSKENPRIKHQSWTSGGPEVSTWTWSIGPCEESDATMKMKHFYIYAFLEKLPVAPFFFQFLPSDLYSLDLKVNSAHLFVVVVFPRSLCSQCECVKFHCTSAVMEDGTAHLNSLKNYLDFTIIIYYYDI